MSVPVWEGRLVRYWCVTCRRMWSGTHTHGDPPPTHTCGQTMIRIGALGEELPHADDARTD